MQPAKSMIPARIELATFGLGTQQTYPKQPEPLLGTHRNTAHSTGVCHESATTALLAIALVVRWVERFKAKISGGSACRLWNGAKQSRGYGSFANGAGSVLAHRLAWEFERGPIPDGLTIDHVCCERLCQNVEHMELVTSEENLSRAAQRMVVCRRGHPLSGANLYVYPGKGTRGCRACRANNRGRERAVAALRAEARLSGGAR